MKELCCLLKVHYFLKLATFPKIDFNGVIAYYVIKRQEPYRELGINYFDQQRPEATTKRLVKRLEQLGYQVAIVPQTSTTPAS